MDDQEAQELIDSQPGENLAEQEASATKQLKHEEDLAQTSFYETLTRLTEHYSDFKRHRQVTLAKFYHTINSFADVEEQREALAIMNTSVRDMERRSERCADRNQFIC